MVPIQVSRVPGADGAIGNPSLVDLRNGRGKFEGMGTEKLVQTSGDLTPPHDPESVPEELRDKSPEEIASIYTNLKKEVGRQGNEIGELRAMLKNMNQPQQPAADFFEQPEQAVKEAVQAQVAPLVAAQFDAHLSKERPHWQETVQDPAFAEWVLASNPRKRLLGAAQAFDAESAIELIDMWDQHNGVSEEQQVQREARAVAKDRKLRSASSESGTSRRSRGKIYSRRWIRHLKETSPAQYKAQLSDIMRAYEEGRVTD